MNKNLKIGVVGDNLVDLYRYGKCDRISPEAPIPVLFTERMDQEICPGGALNVCYQFKNFDCQVTSFGLIDEEAKEFFPFIDTSGCATINMPIPRKIRFYSDRHPLLRYDIEDNEYPDIDKRRKQIIELFSEKVKDFDVIILSNYNKGLFNHRFASEIISLCENKPCIVDPKSNIHFWEGCTIFKPNSREAFNMTGERCWKKQ